MATVKNLDEENQVVDTVVEETPVVEEAVETPVVEEVVTPKKKSTKKKVESVVEDIPVEEVSSVEESVPAQVVETPTIILSVSDIKRQLRNLDNATNYRYELEDLFNIRYTRGWLSLEPVSKLLTSNASPEKIYDSLR